MCSISCTTWTPAQGLSDEAWQAVRACRWHGNIRALNRVMEAAFVDAAVRGDGSAQLQLEDIRRGLALWEPADHHSHALYASN